MKRNGTLPMQNTSVERLSFTVEQFRIATGFSKNRVYTAIAAGDLKSFKNGKRRFIGADAAREFIALCEQRTTDGTATVTPRSPGRRGRTAKAPA
jgi:hypothetical protein